MDDLFLLGRIIFGGFFTYNGANLLLSNASSAQYAAAKGVPMPEVAVAIAGMLILIGGLSVLLGLWPHVGAACIILFLAVITPVMHNFWAVTDPAQRLADMINFTKNVALLGGALMMLGVPTPWPYSVDRRRRIAA
jgi:putative oxidoreductase